MIYDSSKDMKKKARPIQTDVSILVDARLHFIYWLLYDGGDREVPENSNEVNHATS